MTDDLDDIEESSGAAGSRFGGPPAAKARSAVQRAVTGLLDELAPERPAPRAGRPPVAVEQYRTPNGVVLQAASAAVSVSWFPDTTSEVELGELQVILWRGIVNRRGAAPRKERAEVVREMVLRPYEQAPEDYAWRAADGTTYTSASLSEHCLALLAAQTGAPAGASSAAS
jgi:hypothetical protein